MGLVQARTAAQYGSLTNIGDACVRLRASPGEIAGRFRTNRVGPRMGRNDSSIYRDPVIVADYRGVTLDEFPWAEDGGADWSEGWLRERVDFNWVVRRPESWKSCCNVNSVPACCPSMTDTDAPAILE